MAEEPAELVAVIIKLAVAVKEILETVTVFPEKLKLTGAPFCVTVIPCLLEIFSTVAVTDANVVKPPRSRHNLFECQ